MRWLRSEYCAEIRLTHSATYVETTQLLLIGNQLQVSKGILTMLILVLNLVTRIKFGHHTCCPRHAPRLHEWIHGKKSLNFEIPTVWMELTNHVTDCYFCTVDMTGINRKNWGNLKYPDLQSAHCSIVHCDEIPVPILRTSGH